MKKVAKSKKHPKAEEESNVVEKEKASSQPKKMGSEIDEIFAEKKRKRLEKDKATLLPKKKMGSEIDEIFAGKKRKKMENEKKGEGKPMKAAASNAKPLEKQKGKSIKSRSSLQEHSSTTGSSQRRKKTVDGLSVFTEEELGLGKPDAGGTALCPFDCNCCF